MYFDTLAQPQESPTEGIFGIFQQWIFLLAQKTIYLILLILFFCFVFNKVFNNHHAIRAQDS